MCSNVTTFSLLTDLGALMWTTEATSSLPIRTITPYVTCLLAASFTRLQVGDESFLPPYKSSHGAIIMRISYDGHQKWARSILTNAILPYSGGHPPGCTAQKIPGCGDNGASGSALLNSPSDVIFDEINQRVDCTLPLSQSKSCLI